MKGYRQLKDVYTRMIRLVIEGCEIESIGSHLAKDYPYLNISYKGDQPKTSDFNQNTKSEVFLKSALENASKCKICNGYIHINSISIDHIERKQDGGIGVADNGQIAHPL